MADRICSVDGCGAPHCAKGLCRPHYKADYELNHPRPKTPRKPRPICAVEGCGKPHSSHGYCSTHSARFVRLGTPHIVVLTAEDRFWRDVDKSAECWLWTGRVSDDGYVRFTVSKGHSELAHRYSYTICIGAVPDDLHVDHKCHNTDLTCPGGPTCLHRRCVNPTHLEPVTLQENLRRGRGTTNPHMAQKTHCPRGHEYTPENTYHWPGARGASRQCRECKKVPNPDKVS